jgi:hypothetical protein
MVGGPPDGFGDGESAAATALHARPFQPFLIPEGVRTLREGVVGQPRTTTTTGFEPGRRCSR